MDMKGPDPRNRRPERKPKTYILTDQGLTLQRDCPAPAAPAQTKHPWGSPLLWLSLPLS